MTKPSVSVAIPALNEQENIGPLLAAVLKQHANTFDMTEVFVYSDASTDNTNAEVLKFKDPRVHLIEGTERQGVSNAFKQMIAAASGDYMFFLNADILINDFDLFQKIMTQLQGPADFAAGALTELEPKTWVEKILFVGVLCKRRIFRGINQGINMYTCAGPMRAFKKEIYKNFDFPYSMGDDMYSYLYAKSRGYTYQWVPDAKVFYRLPTTYKDYLKQSTRFFQSNRMISELFDANFFKQETDIPRRLVLKSVILTFLEHPIMSTVYFLFLMTTWTYSWFRHEHANLWEVALTSKKL